MPKNETSLYMRIDEDLKTQFKVASTLAGLDMTSILTSHIASFVDDYKRREPDLFAKLVNIEKMRLDLAIERANLQSTRKTA